MVNYDEETERLSKAELLQLIHKLNNKVYNLNYSRDDLKSDNERLRERNTLLEEKFEEQLRIQVAVAMKNQYQEYINFVKTLTELVKEAKK